MLALQPVAGKGLALVTLIVSEGSVVVWLFGLKLRLGGFVPAATLNASDTRQFELLQFAFTLKDLGLLFHAMLMVFVMVAPTARLKEDVSASVMPG